MAFERTAAHACLIRDGGPCRPGPLAHRPEQQCPGQKPLGWAAQRHLLPPIAPDSVRRHGRVLSSESFHRGCGWTGILVLRESADVLDGSDKARMQRMIADQPPTQKQQWIVVPRVDLCENPSQPVSRFFGPHDMEAGRFDLSEPLKALERQRRHHDTRGPHQTMRDRLSEPGDIRVGALEQPCDTHARTSEELLEPVSRLRRAQPGGRKRPFDTVANIVGVAIESDHVDDWCVEADWPG